MSGLKSFIILPPFGRWVQPDWATPVLGSYTWQARPGLWWQIARTLRKSKGGWVNGIGLRNPGLASVKDFKADALYSLVGFHEGDWRKMFNHMPSYVMVEINLGCPNAPNSYGISTETLRIFVEKFALVSVKIPPIDEARDMVRMVWDAGGRLVHLCNTLPTARGGESGTRLKEVSLPLVRWCREAYPDMAIIAGGGIYRPRDAQDYLAAGAQYLSLATVWFTPWRAWRLWHELEKTGPQ